MTIAKNFVDFVFPTETADGYYMNTNKGSVDSFIYLDPEWYDQLLKPNTFYILGPKGSGKTLYAAYMCAEIRDNTISKSYTISVDDYGKLISMKRSNQLAYTDYQTMWKFILLQKFLYGIQQKELIFWGRNKSFESIQQTISNHFGYDVTADEFNPVTFIDKYAVQSSVTNYLNDQFELGTKTKTFSASASGNASTEDTQAESSETALSRRISSYTDTWLQSINAFKKTLEKISFRYNHYLFVDGLDVRPENIDAAEYSECIGALVRAVYSLNSQMFGNMCRADKKMFKIIALTRTDVFLNSNLVNVTSCISDNCVELDWTFRNEHGFKRSKLYKMMNRILEWDGQSSPCPVETYLGFNMRVADNHETSANLQIQRLSRLRPRDIVKQLTLIQNECKSRNISNPSPVVFSSSSPFVYQYSKYYWDQVNSEMMFRFSTSQRQSIIELLRSLNMIEFSENQFRLRFKTYCTSHPDFSSCFQSHRDLVDVLYSLDVIGWAEKTQSHTRMHWHYRETSAIEEAYRLPWERFDYVVEPFLLIHPGARRYIVGCVRAR